MSEREQHTAGRGGANAETLSSFAPGSNVLVRGPSLLGKRRLAQTLLTAHPVDEHPVALAASVDAESFRQRLTLNGYRETGENCFVVDAVRSQVSGDFITCTDGGNPRTWYVSSPADLTGLGMETMQALGSASEGGCRPRLLVDSLSTLLQYNQLERVYRFLHVLNGRISASGGITIQVVHSDSHREQTVSTLSHMFDTVFDVTEGEAGEQVTVRGGSQLAGTTLSLSEALSMLTKGGRDTPSKSTVA